MLNYPTYFYPKYDEELNELNDLFFENFGKLKIDLSIKNLIMDILTNQFY